jgi:hypothetical protein
MIRGSATYVETITMHIVSTSTFLFSYIFWEYICNKYEAYRFKVQ